MPRQHAPPTARRSDPSPTPVAQAPVGVDDPGRVAVAVLTAVHTTDTTTDRGPRDAFTRALPLLGGQVAADVRGGSGPTGPGADWIRWAAHRARTVVTVTSSADSGAPPDTPTAAYRQCAVIVTAVGRDHWQDDAVTYIAFIALVRRSAGWRVIALEES